MIALSGSLHGQAQKMVPGGGGITQFVCSVSPASIRHGGRRLAIHAFAARFTPPLTSGGGSHPRAVYRPRAVTDRGREPGYPGPPPAQNRDNAWTRVTTSEFKNVCSWMHKRTEGGAE
jgi:hypothetical protein